MRFFRIQVSVKFFRDASAPSLKVNYNFFTTWFYGKTTFIVASTKNDFITISGTRLFLSFKLTVWNPFITRQSSIFPHLQISEVRQPVPFPLPVLFLR